MIPLPARQVHLDFHTSGQIPGVGARFDKGQFQEALRLGRVNLINIFAKCHHSWSYYPTQVGRMHPMLSIDLLGQEIEACHEMGVRAPIYYTVGWSATEAEEHPEWCVRNVDGSFAALHWDPEARAEDPRPATSWKYLCPSGEYAALMLAQTEEICRLYEVDGLWYDICNTYPVCYCENCRRGMRAEGIDLADEEAVFGYNVAKWKRFQAQCEAIVHGRHRGAGLFFNGTTKLNTPNRNEAFRMYEFNTQHDLEDLPTTWGGYDKLPMRSKYFHNTGRPMVAMSGKFHTTWGEFGGFKHPDAMRYEAAAMVAYGAACNFGDQLHPAGEMDLETYRRIGEAYAYVEQIEAYGVGGKPTATLGVWRSNSEPDDEGVARILLETQTDFVVVDPQGDLAPYRAIILTGAPCLAQEEANKLGRYVAGGGSLLALAQSILDRRGQRVVLDVGADYMGPPEYDIDYLVLGDVLGRGLVSSPFLNYEAALRVRPRPGSQVLASVREPYFSRTYGRYCSHQNTPYRLEDAAHAGALRTGNVVYLPHALGRLYHAHGARLHRDLFSRALGLIYQEPMIETRMPSAGRISLLYQPEERRYVAHLLYAPPMQRGRCLVIEDLPPLYDVPLALRLPEPIRRAYLVPGGEEVSPRQEAGALRMIVPVVQGHQAVALEY